MKAGRQRESAFLRVFAFIFRDWWLKLIALALATGIYLLVHNSINTANKTANASAGETNDRQSFQQPR